MLVATETGGVTVIINVSTGGSCLLAIVHWIVEDKERSQRRATVENKLNYHVLARLGIPSFVGSTKRDWTASHPQHLAPVRLRPATRLAGTRR
jgi:hypothetical protein